MIFPEGINSYLTSETHFFAAASNAGPAFSPPLTFGPACCLRNIVMRPSLGLIFMLVLNEPPWS